MTLADGRALPIARVMSAMDDRGYALALLFLLQGVLGGSLPVTVPYSRFQTMLEQGQIEEALIGATSIRFKLRADAPLPDDLRKMLERGQPLAARWAGAEPERVFEVNRLPNIDDNTLLEQLTQKGVVFAGRIESTSGAICCSPGFSRSGSGASRRAA